MDKELCWEPRNLLGDEFMAMVTSSTPSPPRIDQPSSTNPLTASLNPLIQSQNCEILKNKWKPFEATSELYKNYLVQEITTLTGKNGIHVYIIGAVPPQSTPIVLKE